MYDSPGSHDVGRHEASQPGSLRIAGPPPQHPAVREVLEGSSRELAPIGLACVDRELVRLGRSGSGRTSASTAIPAIRRRFPADTNDVAGVHNPEARMGWKLAPRDPMRAAKSSVLRCSAFTNTRGPLIRVRFLARSEKNLTRRERSAARNALCCVRGSIDPETQQKSGERRSAVDQPAVRCPGGFHHGFGERGVGGSCAPPRGTRPRARAR